jgi:hypothetical protein
MGVTTGGFARQACTCGERERERRPRRPQRRGEAAGRGRSLHPPSGRFGWARLDGPERGSGRSRARASGPAPQPGCGARPTHLEGPLGDGHEDDGHRALWARGGKGIGGRGGGRGVAGRGGEGGGGSCAKGLGTVMGRQGKGMNAQQPQARAAPPPRLPSPWRTPPAQRNAAAEPQQLAPPRPPTV